MESITRSKLAIKSDGIMESESDGPTAKDSGINGTGGKGRGTEGQKDCPDSKAYPDEGVERD